MSLRGWSAQARRGGAGQGGGAERGRRGGAERGFGRRGGAERDRLDQSWTRTWPARIAREAILCGPLDLIIRGYGRIEVRGREWLTRLDGPVIFVAGHASHIDTPILQRALPGRRRRRTAFAAAADYFYRRRLAAAFISFLFCTVPLDRRAAPGEVSTIERLRRIVLEEGWSLAVYPEGTRSRDGRVGVLQPGAAALAMQLELPLVPVHISGTGELMPVGARWPRRRRGGLLGRFGGRVDVTVTFGAPIRVRPGDDRFEVMERVRIFMAECGAETTPDPKRLRRVAARARLNGRGADGGQAETSGNG